MQHHKSTAGVLVPIQAVNPAALAALHAIYDRLPVVECRGKCAKACGPIDMTSTERQHIRRETGMEIPRGNSSDTYTCPALGILGTCTVYEHRPLICRAYGATEALACPYGCTPAEGAMSDREFFSLMSQAMVAAGDWPRSGAQRIEELLDDPTALALLRKVAAGDQAARLDLYRYARQVGRDASTPTTGTVSARYNRRVERGLAALSAVYEDCA